MKTAAQIPLDGREYGMSRLLTEVFDLREGTLATVLQRLLQAARMHMGMDVAFISKLEQGLRRFYYVDQAQGVDLLKVGDSDPLEESYCQKVVEGSLPELMCNAQTVEEAKKLEATEAVGVGAHMSIPIRLRDGSVFGTFCCFSFQADYSLNERDHALMTVFAEIAAELLEKDVQRAKEEEQTRRKVDALLAEDGVAMMWQPVVEMVSGRIIGVEALARFPSAEGMGPPQWFEEAASVGLANELEARAIASGLEILGSLPADQYVACNASAQAVLKGDIFDLLVEAPLSRVVLEITEHDIVADYRALCDAIAPLRRRGMRLAIDDAGAGYSSFRHILRLRPDIIKLDMSLTRHIDSDLGRRALAGSLVTFAREIGCKLIAEGVEAEGELQMLAQLGVEAAQGFYLHRPKPARDLTQILARQA
ncbi:sensor domain-containing phosphodiesterase [Marinimicrobium locisalis]|uniref:sensor domain-containing phosphodiesterase n=1 Tax=Marinimicrobium locisalis TaxID=546022 RepID=UPI0032214F25